jgi:SAM-dependent methyltransferase
MICECGFRNRTRAALQIAIQDLGLDAKRKIYITEQFGITYRWLKGRFPDVTGSEYLFPNRPSGSSLFGINHQDIQALSFSDSSFDFVLSFDVLEHVPDSFAALKEISRITRPGGTLLLTVPFTAEKYQNTVRAEMDSKGKINHILPAEVHGNPTDPKNGALCFRHYGWELLDQLRELYFQDVFARFYYNERLGYRGRDQMVVSAVKI